MCYRRERPKKHSVLQPATSIRSAWIPVRFPLLFMRLWFHQMDQAALSPMKKREVLVFSTHFCRTFCSWPPACLLFLALALLLSGSSCESIQRIEEWMFPCSLRAVSRLRERSLRSVAKHGMRLPHDTICYSQRGGVLL